MFLCLGGMILVTLLRLDLAIEAERLPQVAVILADMVIVADVMMLVALFFSLTHRPCLPLFTLVQSFKMFRLVQWVSTWVQVKVLWCLAATREGASVLDLRLHVWIGQFVHLMSVLPDRPKNPKASNCLIWTLQNLANIWSTKHVESRGEPCNRSTYLSCARLVRRSICGTSGTHSAIRGKRYALVLLVSFSAIWRGLSSFHLTFITVWWQSLGIHSDQYIYKQNRRAGCIFHFSCAVNSGSGGAWCSACDFWMLASTKLKKASNVLQCLNLSINLSHVHMFT